jgi:hypothetical protein
MNRFSFMRLPVAMLVVVVVATPCNAARVYQLVNYPTDQAMHSLSGTITTTDEAPLDSILETAEILDWQWSITGANTTIASRNDFLTDRTMASGIRISPTAIELPLGTPDNPLLRELVLSRETSLAPRGAYRHTLSWGSRWLIDTQEQFNRYSASSMQGDAIQGYWNTSGASLGPDSWVIARAVPEPATLIVGVLAILAAAHFACRRRVVHIAII